MPMRPAARKFERDELVAYLHGIDAEGNVVNILVHNRGGHIRFAGGIKKDDVASANSRDLESWIYEAQSACGLSDVMGTHRGYTHEPEYLERYELLSAKALERKKELATSGEL